MKKSAWTGKKILITGGLGFIGKSFAKRLLTEDTKVYIFDSGEGGVQDHWTNGATLITGRVENQTDWETIPACDYVFHFGAPSSVVLFNSDLDRCVTITISGFLNALQWSIRHNVTKLIYPSSGSIFGLNDQRCSETTLPAPVNSYGKTKLACEYLAQIYGNKINTLGLRIFAGYGQQEDQKNEIASIVTLFLQAAMNTTIPVIYGDGEQTRDFVYIDDIVEVLYHSSDPKLSGVLNIGSGQSTSFNDVIKKINMLLPATLKPTYVAKPEAYLQNTACDTQKIETILGRKPITIDEGLRHYITSLKK